MGLGRPGSQREAWDVVPEARSQALQLVLGTRWKGSFQGPHCRPAEPDVLGEDGEQSVSPQAPGDWGPWS